MDDLAGKLQSILSSKEGQEQIKNIQEMLGMSGSSGAPSGGQTPSEQPPSEQAQSPAGASPGTGGLPDLSSLLGMLGQGGGGQAPSGQAGGTGGFDLSSLMGMLGQQSNPASNPPDGSQGGSPDLSSLLSMLGQTQSGQTPSGQPNAGAGSSTDISMPNIDLNMILKLQQVFKSMNVNDKNSQLLLALKPHFSERRQSKVDQAISMMRLMNMLPMLKESGIFSGL